jgi:glyoxylase-like metal-dependent hydrolase (beta-lactamase superfamily II)
MLDEYTGIERIVVGGISTNCYIVPFANRTAAVIDPGDNARGIVERLDARRLKPTRVLLTHGHFDHIAALPALMAILADRGLHPNVMIHKNDAAFLGPNAYAAHATSWNVIGGGDMSFIDNLWQEMPEPTTLLNEGDQIGPFVVLHLPGHSAGSIGFYDVSRDLLFGGDTLFFHGIGRADLPESNSNDLRNSVQRILALKPATTVHPGHGPATTVATELQFFE